MVLRRADHRTQQEYGALEYRLSYLAGAARLGSSLVIEALHLTNGTLSQGRLRRRHWKIAAGDLYR